MAHARATDPDTSHEAAASVRNETITHRRILTVLGIGVMTDEAIVEAFIARYGDKAASPSGIRSRRKELVAMGKIAPSAIKSRTASGRASTLWHVIPSES